MTRLSSARLVLGLLSLVPLSAPTRGQAPDRHGSDPTPVVSGPPLILPSDRQLARRIEAARDYIRARDWPQAVRILQALLDHHEDAFAHLSSAKARGAPRWVSLRAEAERLLSELPAAGKDFYNLTYEPAARRLLEQARAHKDLAALHEVVRRYRFTSVGSEALALLGSYYLDRGQHTLAAACYQQLLRQDSGRRLPPPTLLKAILAFRGVSGSSHAAELESQTWKQLAAQVSDEGLTLGQRTLSLDALRRAVARRPGQVFGDETPLFRHDPLRSGAGQTGDFVLEPCWSRNTVAGELRSGLRHVHQEARSVWPGAVPLAVAGKVIYRGHDGLHALDAASGAELWHRPSPLAAASLLARPGSKVQLQHWLAAYGAEQTLLFENTLLGTLSSDGQRVYAVEDLPAPPPPALMAAREDGKRSALGPLRYHAERSRLRAVDLETGALRWEIPAPLPSSLRPGEAREEGGYFLGPPLPVGNRLFVLADLHQDVQLLCLDAADGRLVWRQTLAGARDRMALSLQRRLHACPLAQADGILVCPTHCGGVFGVDLLTGSLRWVHLYHDMTDTETTADPSSPEAALARWKMAGPVIHGDRVVFTAVDSPDLVCLRLHDGGKCWKIQRRHDDLLLAGVHNDRVLVLGKKTCRALSLADGTILWETPTDLPAGQGLLCAGHYYLPLECGDILVLELDRPHLSRRLERRRSAGSLPVGNLVSYRGLLWSQNLDSVTAFPPLTVFLARIEEQLARRPSNYRTRFERAVLRQARGDLPGAVEDLHEILAHPDCAPDLRRTARTRLYRTLTQWLERDFVQAEKHLEEYRALCRVPIPAELPTAHQTPLRQEEQRRHALLHTLVARGRHEQGRLLEAALAYEALLGSAGSEPLVLAPDDTAVQLRPDLWVQKRVAALLRAASATQRRRLAEHFRARLERFTSQEDLHGLLRLATLLAEAPGELGRLGQQAQLVVAEQALRGPGPLPPAEMALRLDLLAEQADTPAVAARALFLRTELLTRYGRLDDALACYRRLAGKYPTTAADGGRTGAALLAELRCDRRFLHLLEEPPNWPQKFRDRCISQRPVKSPPLPCISQAKVWAEVLAEEESSSAVDLLPQPAPKFSVQLDRRSLQLLIRDTRTGQRCTQIPLSSLYHLKKALSEDPDESPLGYQVRDHLLILAIRHLLIGIDLLEGRLLWQHDLAGDFAQPDKVAGNWTSGITATEENDKLQRVFGLVDVGSHDALYVQTDRGLLALDPARGNVRWMRCDLSGSPLLFSDEEHLFAGEPSAERVSSLRALRSRDGASRALPDSSSCLAQRVRIPGRRLLVSEEGANDTLIVRLRDLMTGKDLWRQTFPAGSRLLSASSQELIGVGLPDRNIQVVDFTPCQPAADAPCRVKLALPRQDGDAGNKDLESGVLLSDREHFYVGFSSPNEGGGAPFGDLRATPLQGPLYAFHRDSGRLHWFNGPEGATCCHILLERFEEMPLILYGGYVGEAARPGDKKKALLFSIDKRSGRLCSREETVEVSFPLNTLRLNPYSGTIDLVGNDLLWRHERKAGK
jgi:outer membrane protein assembly factor BamB